MIFEFEESATQNARMKVVGVAQTYPPEKLRAATLVVDSLAALDVVGLRMLFG